MLENILPMAPICQKMICCFEARSHSNVDKAIISENHSVTSFKIKVAHAFKLAQRSTCSTRKNTPCNIALDINASYAFALTKITFVRAQQNANSSMTHSSSTYLHLRCIQKMLINTVFSRSVDKCAFTKPFGYIFQ